MLAWACAALLSLSGCSLLQRDRGDDAAETADRSQATSDGGGRVLGNREAADAATASARDAFVLDVQAPRDIRNYLLRHLELQRYRQLADLDATELSRLLGAADANARQLLGTLGYFAPSLTLELKETPGDNAPRTVLLVVEPGSQARIAEVQVDFIGEIGNAPEAAGQRSAITRDWSLRPGLGFTQEAWDNAKQDGQRTLNQRRFPTGGIKASRAEVDADTSQVKLGVTYDSGPAYRFGPLKLQGAERYDPEAARRLARIPIGADYDEARLLDAQLRLASSGYYDSVFLTLDTEGTDPQAAPVVAQVREAALQKVVFGVGITTDSGPRVSIDHTHNRLPLIGWRALSQLSLDKEAQVLGTEWTNLPAEDGWRWFTGARVQREATGSFDVNSLRVRGGRSKSVERIDRTAFLQYEADNTVGAGAPPRASAISANFGWTGRYFNNLTAPTQGQGLGVELGAGYTLTGERKPYLRTVARWLGFAPLGTVTAADGASRRGRLALRAEGGAVLANSGARIPSPQLFVTGGDTTVRGYGYRDIGARTDSGRTFAGRYLTVASVEWQRPVVWNGALTEFESAVFVDAGAVADTPRDMRTRVGVGAGVRWRSPVGPLQADLAYGVQAERLRLHLRLGFTF